MKVSLKLMACAAFLLMVPALAGLTLVNAEQDTPKPTQVEIDLIGGSSVRGVIVKETGQEIFVDIGPTIVALPKIGRAHV